MLERALSNFLAQPLCERQYAMDYKPMTSYLVSAY